MEIRALRPTDDRSRFESGDPDLDRFLRVYAGQNQFRHHVGTTYVAMERTQLIGFVTVSAGSLEIDDLPATAKRALPGYPLPVLRIARLAVDARYQGGGVGKELLRFALGLSLRMREDYGCVGVVVDAKPDAVSFYGRLGFMALDVTEGLAESRPTPVAMFLAAREIELAQRASRPRTGR